MCKIIAVTNRKLCERDFLEQITRVAASKPDMIILREKDLAEAEYMELARKVIGIGEEYKVPVCLHNFINVAKKLNCERIHLPFSKLKENVVELKSFDIIGTSVHSVEEAMEAEKIGADYVTAGHIFKTNCKPDLTPRGVVFLNNVIQNIHIPVLAIGGIHPWNVQFIEETGAYGYCMMSEFMKM